MTSGYRWLDPKKLVAAKAEFVVRFVWPGRAADMQCTSCQRVSITVQEQAAVEKMPVPTARFSLVH